MAMQAREYVIRQDHLPHMVVALEPDRIAPYMAVLRTRYPDHFWSVSERFPLNGSD